MHWLCTSNLIYVFFFFKTVLADDIILITHYELLKTLSSLKFARNIHPAKTAVTLDRMMKDRPTRKCNLATDQVIHATHDPYTHTHILIWYVGELLSMSSGPHHTYSSVAFKSIQAWPPAKSFSHQQYVPHLTRRFTNYY